MIHIIDKQSDEIVGIIPPNEFWDDNYHRSLETTAETFEFTTFADRDYSEYLTGRNKVIIPDEDNGFRELTIWQAEKIHEHSKHIVVFTKASYNDLRKAQVIKPQTLKSQSASTAAATVLRKTEWIVGLVEGKGSRTIHVEKHTDPYSMLKRIATEFDLELNFRVETKGNKITGRYVDLVQQIGQWRGREIEFGKDLLSIRRIEDTDNIYTALIGLGPEKDGRRLEVLVEDHDALQRWGRRDPVTGELRHIIGTYEPQTEKEELSYDRLRELTKNELEKRIDAAVRYEATFADLEHVPGMENEKVRLGDTNKIKDTAFNPPLYLAARIFEVNGPISDKSKKEAKLGDFIEYTEEEVQAVWKSLQDEIKRSLARMLSVNVVSSAGTVFKNGIGSTELTAVVYNQGNETDKNGETYNYTWTKYDKHGNLDADWSASGKKLTVQAKDIDEKAMYACEVLYQDVAVLGFITLSNVYDGKDGKQGIPGPPGKNGQTLYTWVKYADTPTSGMSDNPNGKEYIGLAYNKTSPNESSNYSDYQWTKYKGDKGVQGPKGADGKTTYTWVKYADDDKGTGMSDNSDGKRYLGLAYNKTTQTESTNPSDYNWSPLYDNVQVGGRNLFVIKDALVNSVFKWADGDVATETDSLVSGFIEVLANENIICNYTISQIMFYDNDKVYIGTYRDGELVPVGGQTRPTDKITVPNKQSIAYMRVSFRDGFLEDASVEGKKVKLEKGNVETDWSPAPEDERAYAEYVAQLKAGLAEEEAKAHADGKVTAEEQARIDQARRNLEEAKQHANDVSSKAETNAKDHADKVSKEKAEEARRQAEEFAENASNIKKGIIDVGSVPIRTAANGARIQWDGTNGLVQYDSKGNPVSWLDLKGNSRFVNAYLSGEIHAKRGVLGDGNVIIDDKGVRIVRPDGAITMQNGLMHNAYAVSADDPYYMTTTKNEVPGAEVGPVFIPGGLYGYKFRARSWYVCLKYSADGSKRKETGYLDVRDGLNAVAFQRYEFVHCARYLIFHYWPHADSGKHSLHVVNGSSDKKEDRIYFQLIEKGTSGIQKCVIDLGKPTFKKRDVTFKIGWVAAWTPSPEEEIIFRMKSVIQTDVL
ncbi:hypothetical protein J32TS6_04900 [Virgibacillus pantothenticus]|uniref:phage tail spike protein n=1 Tax=Virgibacillus pantothenticus TaxID=1473 RepID=UPI001B254CE6|nr:phage tail spike protein [Virgibacillus pantothenticus]GIP61935.1 hypothetical protein J32TS6_04900 [Virgibacillus pantothenticus]